MKRELNKYTSRDLVEIRRQAIESLRDKTDKWSDFNESDLGMVLIEAMAGIADMSNYYLDNQALETNLMTARQAKNIKGILESYNVKLDTLGSAKGSVTLTDTSQHGHYFVVPAYTQLNSSNSIPYITTESVVFSESEDMKEIDILQGVRREVQVSSEDLRKLEEYKYYLPAGPIPTESVTLHQSDVEWSLVDDAFLELSGGSKYSVHEDSDGRVYLLFTYNYREFLPEDPDKKLRVLYVHSEGTRGVVPPWYVNTISDTIYNSSGDPINDEISVLNNESTYGAYDRVNYSKMKAVGRDYIRSMGRNITLNDYKSHLELHRFIVDSYVCDWRSDPTRVTRPFHVKSWVITTDSLRSDYPSNSVFRELSETLMERGDVAVYVSIYPAEPVSLSVNVGLAVRGSDTFRDEVRDEVYEYLKIRFSLYNLSLGDTLTSTELESEIYNLSSSILKVDVDIGGSSIKCSDIQFFRLEELEVNLLNINKLDFGLLNEVSDGMSPREVNLSRDRELHWRDYLRGDTDDW